MAVADRDIHSGVFRTDPYGLATDSFVLQGGDPWGFDAGDAFELSQAWGHYAFLGPVAQAASVPEPALGGLLSLALAAMLPVRALLWPRGRVRGNTRG